MSTDRPDPMAWLTRGPDAARSLAGGAAAILAAVALVAIGGSLGVVAGLAVVGTWYALGPLYAFTIGTVAVVALAGQAPTTELAGPTLAVFGILIAPDLTTPRGRRLAAGTVLGTALLGGLAVGTFALWDTIWITAGLLTAVGAVVAYVLHRYDLIVTGVVSNPDRQ